MPQISVIVPVYKVEQYLRECVDSILGQTYRDFELILVDDGSPDNCGAICDEYAEKDARVRVIHQENRGLSGARNTGIDAARGEFITFVDSDDVVAPNYLLVLHSAVVKNNADISCCKMRNFRDGEDIHFSVEMDDISDMLLLSGRDSAANIYRGTGKMSIFAWGKLYQKNLFKHIRFPIGKLHEDQAIVPILLFQAKRVISIDAPYYCYRNRPDSITHKKFKANRFDNVEAIDSCIAFFKDKKDREIVKEAKKVRKKVNALLVVLALSENAQEEIPSEYYLSKLKAIYYLFMYAPDDTFSWYMALLNPQGTRIHSYALKIRRSLRFWEIHRKCDIKK